MGNGSVERFNRTLGTMIRTMAPDAKVHWPRHLQTLTFMYNCTVHETTGYAPFYLMYGRVPRLPVDVLFNNTLEEHGSTRHDKYVSEMLCDLDAVRVAQVHISKEQCKQSKMYNRKS